MTFIAVEIIASSDYNNIMSRYVYVSKTSQFLNYCRSRINRIKQQKLALPISPAYNGRQLILGLPFVMSIYNLCIDPPQFDPDLGDKGGPRGSKMVSIEISSPHSYSTSKTLWAYLAPFGHNTQHGRQTTDRAIA